jgi:hypothetical protein
MLHQLIQLELELRINTPAACLDSTSRLAQLVTYEPSHDFISVVVGVNEGTIVCTLDAEVYGQVLPRLSIALLVSDEADIKVSVFTVVIQLESHRVIGSIFA